MSRSYKKNPFVTDHSRKTTKEKKKIANHRFRQSIGQDEDMAARPQHKKYSESWEICDYKWRFSKEEAIQQYENGELTGYIYKRYPTLESWLKYWEKCYRRK